MTTCHAMLEQVPLERQKEVAASLREDYWEKQTQVEVEEFNVKQTKQQNANVLEKRQGVHIPTKLAWQVTAICEVCLELQAQGFRAEDVSILGSTSSSFYRNSIAKACVWMEHFGISKSMEMTSLFSLVRAWCLMARLHRTMNDD
jgi:hypothetical protein